MALLKDLIVNGVSRFIGDSYFNSIKAGSWQGSAINGQFGGLGKDARSLGGVTTPIYIDANGVAQACNAYPTTLPASDVPSWAKAATKPSYSFQDVTSHVTETQTDVSWAKGIANQTSTRRAFIYNNSGVEWSYLFGLSIAGTTAQYGSILKFGYDDKYLRILRVKNYEWQSDDWEKISAGYADNSGYTKYIETFKANSTTETYGTSYPIYAQWTSGTDVRFKCTNYNVWVDKATDSTNATNATYANILKPSTITDNLNFAPTIAGVTSFNYKGTASNSPSGIIAGDGEALYLSWTSSQAYANQIAFGADNVGIVHRHSNGSGVWSSWRKLMYSDEVSSWAKAASKPSYHAGELGVPPTTFGVTSVPAGLAPYISEIGTNIFSGATSAEIKVERSTDDGATWTDVTADNVANIKNIFSGCVRGSMPVSARAKAVVGDKLRITFYPTGSTRYSTLSFIYIYFSTNGCGCTCNVEKSWYTDKNHWDALITNAPVAGWSGPNVMGCSSTIFGQGDSRNNGYGLRFTFRINSVNADYDSRGYIYSIQGFTSAAAWGTPAGNSITKGNVPYTYLNADRAVQFDNSVTATSFIKTGGNANQVLLADGSVASKSMTIAGVSVALGGTLSAATLGSAFTGTNAVAQAKLADEATKLKTTRTIWGNYFDGTENVEDWITLSGSSGIKLVENLTGTTGSGLAKAMYAYSKRNTTNIQGGIGFLWGKVASNTTVEAGFTCAFIGAGSSPWSSKSIRVNESAVNLDLPFLSTSSFTGTQFKVTGGKNTQFLKADGSLDSVAYLPLTGGEVNGSIKVNGNIAVTGMNTLKIGEATLAWDSVHGCLVVDKSFSSLEQVSALGASSDGTTGGGSGNSNNVYCTQEEYDALVDAGQVVPYIDYHIYEDV